ncbi:MAG: hypothetical protein KKD63_01790 [Proteobacteria bacterium]|nr:hypothetical protein [Desulfobulbaceae bacterium]MBU4151592.1 hypothetical protein [Pseudomonadota bacterium]
MANNKEIINRIFDHIENGDVDKAAFACVRLSRNIGDIFNTIIFLRELYPNKKQFAQTFYDETINLKKAAQDFLWKKTLDHWVEERTLLYSLTDEPDETVLALGVGEMQKELFHLKETIADLNIPKGMGEYDAAAFTDRYDFTKSKLRLRISGITTINERIRTRCLNYASRIEKQIETQEKPNLFLSDVQNKVNNYFSSRSDEIFRKLQKASILLGSTNPEDNALLLASIRRAINSVADYYFPPQKGEVMCSDGITRKMGKEQYLNRLYEFCSKTYNSSTSNELIRAELDYLMVFAKKLNEIASKGVHAEVSSAEAKQGLVGLYLFLSNIIEKIEYNNS